MGWLVVGLVDWVVVGFVSFVYFSILELPSLYLAFPLKVQVVASH